MAYFSELPSTRGAVSLERVQKRLNWVRICNICSLNKSYTKIFHSRKLSHGMIGDKRFRISVSSVKKRIYEYNTARGRMRVVSSAMNTHCHGLGEVQTTAVSISQSVYGLRRGIFQSRCDDTTPWRPFELADGQAVQWRSLYRPIQKLVEIDGLPS